MTPEDATTKTADPTDTEMLDWLGQKYGTNLVSDDDGRWAVSDMGMQPVPPEGGFTDTAGITSIVMPEEWRPTIRDALRDAMGQALQPGNGTDRRQSAPRLHKERGHEHT